MAKIYLVNKSSAVAQVQRNAKVLIFDPFVDSAADRMAGVSKKGLQLYKGSEDGGQDLNRKMIKSMHPTLLGPPLDVMNKNMVSNLSKSVDELASSGAGKPLDLYGWARHAITIASTDAVWGNKNPLKSREIEDAFWDFDTNLGLLPFKIFPSIIARKSYLGREKVVAAFVKYYNDRGQNEASDLAKARWKVQHENGATTEDIARMETSTVLGVISNTSPTSFWMIYDVYSRPELLVQLRDEIRENALKRNESGDPVIDLAAIKDSCPNLLATFQECLRTRSNSSPTRFVQQDVVLNDKYLLKKGRILIMPSQNMNYESSIWGDDSEKFDPSRFKKEALKQRPTSFMSFGASPSLCPGRHFASGEILGMAAMMILRFDITPVGGKWTMPKFCKGAIAASMPSPGEAFNVTVSPREEYAGATWDFSVVEGKGKFPLITG